MGAITIRLRGTDRRTTETATTGHAPAPIPADVAEALGAYDDARAKANAADDAFGPSVHPDVWKMHVEVMELEGAAHFENTRLHVEELCRHFPGLAPAIRVMWMHVLDERMDRLGRCCTNGGPIVP